VASRHRRLRHDAKDGDFYGGYGWLAETPVDRYLTAGIVDVAHIVATHALAEEQPDLAMWVAERAIAAAPSEDKPRLDLVRAMKMLGRDQEAQTYQRDLQPDRR